jgi:alpha-L-arabinofuranosidase
MHFLSKFGKLNILQLKKIIMKNFKLYFGIFILFNFNIIFAQTTKIEISVEKELSKINPLLFGMNVARWDESLFPGPGKDKLRTCDRDAINKIIEAKFTLLKYPGGNDADAYIWNNPLNNDSEMDTDEYAELLKCTGTVGFITINFNQPPKLAADWVRYCNITNNYNIKLWEVGDEQWGDWAKGHTTPESYAKKFIEFTKAMKEADPSIKTVMNVKMENDPNGWTIRALKEAKDYVDIVTITYFPISTKYDNNEKMILSSPKDFIEPYNDVRKALKSVYGSPKGDTMWIIPVGYNTISSYPGPVTVSIVNALWTVDMIGIMANLGVSSACYWAFHNAYPPRGGDFGVLSSEGSNTPYYSYYAHKMMTHHLKDKMVSCLTNDTLLTAYASADISNNLVSLFLINKDKVKNKEAEINFKDFKNNDHIKGWILNNENKYSEIKDIQFTDNKVKIPPYSAVVLEFENINYKPEPENLALKAKTSASSYSVSFPYFHPKYATDGLTYTRWASASWVSKDGNDNQWLQMEFEDVTAFNTIKIFWDNGYGINYNILTSNDGKEWNNISTIEDGKGGIEIITLKPVHAKFLKLELKKGKKAISTYNIKELEVYNIE